MTGRYTPTAGMLRALCDAPTFTAFDLLRCRMRGLVTHDDRITDAGRACISREIKRRQELGRG